MRTAFTLHPFQQQGLDDFRRFMDGPQRRRCYAAPTGTGKGIFALEAQALAVSLGSRAFVVAPRLEIISGLLAKLNPSLIRLSEAATRQLGESEFLFTPVRLRNLLLSGSIPAPDLLIIDEGHHDAAETYQQIHALCDCRAIALTATPFRGTPKGTAAFRATWGPPVTLLTYPDAIRSHYISFPRIHVTPLCDDDVIEVQAGEFQVQAVSEYVRSRLAAVVDLARPMCPAGTWDTPTMFSCPSTEVCRDLVDRLTTQGYPAVSVTEETPYTERQANFDLCISSRAALVQINVVSEGIDLPIRRLIDLSPTLSPVKWLQQLGRITRPGGISEYLCTNRNLLRHAYLLEGCLPPGILADATTAFAGPGKRLATRVLGLEALGRLKAAELPLADGTTGLMYQIASAVEADVTEYAVLVHPAKAEPIWARRRRTKGPDARYGKWMRCHVPEGIEGFASVPASPLSPKQASWWKTSAKRFNLDPDAPVTRKNFAALPVLSDLRMRL